MREQIMMILLILYSTSFVCGQGLGGPPSRDAQPPRGVRSGQPAPLVSAHTKLPHGVEQLQNGMYRVTDTRPLEVLAELLSLKLGVPIAYEEPGWVSNADVIRASDYPGSRGVKSLSNPRGPLIPRGGSLTVVIPASPVEAAANAAPIIESAIASHQAAKNPGYFKLVRFGDGEFSIVADRAENASGQIVTQIAPLDTRISLPQQERTLAQTLDLIYQSVSTAAQVRLVDPVGFNQYFKNTRVRIGANNEIARDVLARALHIPGAAKLTWRLRFDPENKNYGIFVTQVQAEVPMAGGGTGVRTLAWPK